MTIDRETIFLDTNVLLDVLLRRPNFLHASLHIWQISDYQLVHSFISAISINNIHYILHKNINKKDADEAITIIINIFSIVPLDERILRLAAAMPGKDFEDAIQIQSARACGAQTIITRDSKHFADCGITCMAPAQYLSLPTISNLM